MFKAKIRLALRQSTKERPRVSRTRVLRRTGQGEGLYRQSIWEAVVQLDTPVDQLYKAAWNGKEDQVDEIVSRKGINVTNQTRLENLGWTALHFAARRDKINPIKLLLKKNADLNLKEINGATPLHFAAVKGHLRVVQYLAAYRSDLKAVDNLNATPKDVAKTNEIKEFLTKLEILKEDVNEFDLMVMCNQEKKVEELLKIRFGKHKIGEYVAYNQEVHMY